MLRLAIVSVWIGILMLGALALGATVGNGGGTKEGGGQELELTGLESGFIDVDGGKIFYERAGTGDAIVLIHDGLVHREAWDGQFPFFAQDHTVVRYDRRGYGSSPMPDQPYSNIDDLSALFSQLKIDRATLMGVSAGGGLAIDFTLKYPEKVTALVLVGAVVSGLGYTDHMYTRGGRLSAADYANREYMGTYWLDRDPYEMAPGSTAAREVMKQLVRTNPQDLDDTKARLVRGPERPALPNLKEISVPTLILVGEYDIPDVHAHAGAIEAGIPGAQRVIIPNTGHLVAMEAPDVFNERVTFMLKQAEFLGIIATQGVEAAARAFEEARAKDPEVVLFGEARLNQMGYERLSMGNVDEAIALFKINVAAYPGSWNVYDSLGEAYAAKGERDLAIQNYEKSVELNPANESGKRVIEDLRRR